MRTYPLVWKIWSLVASVAISIGLLLLLTLPYVLSGFFAEEMYKTIESVQKESNHYIVNQLQNALIQQELGITTTPGENQFTVDDDIRIVLHVVIHENGLMKSRFKITPQLSDIFMASIDEYEQQQTTRFTKEYNNKTLFMSVKRTGLEENTYYLISFLTNDYLDSISNKLLLRIEFFIFIAIVLSWIPAYFLANYVTSPIVLLRQRVGIYAKRNLTEPIEINRSDEIGQLAQSIDHMRTQLLEHDETQKNVLQHISHELKTPVMVAKGYVHAILDGVIKPLEIDQTLVQLDDELNRLDKKIAELIYMSKLDFCEQHEPVLAEFSISQLLEQLLPRMRMIQPDLLWEIDLIEVRWTGNEEQWRVAFENVMDNQVRYATRKVWVRMFTTDEQDVHVVIGNNGVRLEDGTEQSIFEAFRIGTNGRYGLGLAIVKRVADMHDVTVYAENDEQGVSFHFVFTP
jgi:two-component system sensor histidine kinase CssS